MKTKITIFTLCMLYYLTPALGTPDVVCYWDQTSSENRTGIGKIGAHHTQLALSNCTRMIIGFADINATTSKLSSVPTIPFNCTEIKCPKFFLGVGKGINYDSNFSQTCMNMSRDNDHLFVFSILEALNNSGYDGVDLAWQFPNFTYDRILEQDAKVLESFYGLLGVPNPIEDSYEERMREQFTFIVRMLSVYLGEMNKTVSISILPHTNVSKFYETLKLGYFVDRVHVLAFDYAHPSSGAKVTFQLDEVLSQHYESVRFWLESAIPISKIVIGLPTFARTWMSPEATNELGPPGLVSQKPGILSYSEVCSNSPHYRKVIKQSNSTHLRPGLGKLRYIVRVSPTDDAPQDARFEGYYFPPDFIFTEAEEINWHEIGGIALYELSLDDADGVCTGQKFPYLMNALEGLKRKC